MHVHLYYADSMYLTCFVSECHVWDKPEGLGYLVFVFVVFEPLKQVLPFCLSSFLVDALNEVGSLYSNTDKVLKTKHPSDTCMFI